MSDFFRQLAGRVVDKDDFIATALIPANSTGLFAGLNSANNVNVVIQKQVKPGIRRVFIAGHMQAWDAGGNGFLTFHLLVNGKPVHNYESSQTSFGVPGTGTLLAVEVEVPQLAVIAVTVDLGGASSSINFTEELLIYYVEDDRSKPAQIGVAG